MLVTLHPATSGTPGSHRQACRTVQIARAASLRPLAPLVCSLHSRRLGIVGHPGNGQGRSMAQSFRGDWWDGPMNCAQACCLQEQGLLATRLPDFLKRDRDQWGKSREGAFAVDEHIIAHMSAAHICGDSEARGMRGQASMSKSCIQVCCMLQANRHGWAEGAGPIWPPESMRWQAS